MRDGNLVSECKIKEIVIASLPDKLEYYNGEQLDTTGMVVKAVRYDGSETEITDYIYDEYVSDNIKISYISSNEIYSTYLNVTIKVFDPAIELVDFTYTTSIGDNGITYYTLTGWKQTLNGEPSTEMVIPDIPFVIL